MSQCWQACRGALPRGEHSSGVPFIHTSASQPLQPILPCAVSARMTWHVHSWQLLHSYEGGLPDGLPLTEKLMCQGRPCCCPLSCSLLLDAPAEALLETCRKTHELEAVYLGIACKLTDTYFSPCISLMDPQLHGTCLKWIYTRYSALSYEGPKELTPSLVKLPTRVSSSVSSLVLGFQPLGNLQTPPEV